MEGDEELLPIFPLANVVLFPRVKTPLHLFEPRYRQLAREVLAAARRIGMVVVRPEHTDAMIDDPPVFPIGCAGTVTESQRLPDGRYNIVLLGEERFRVIDEPPRPEERLYRVARVRYLVTENDPADAERIERLRANVVESLGALVRYSQPEKAASFAPDLFAGVDDETFVNALANSLALAPEDKQRLLEADRLVDRFARLAGILGFQRAEIEARGSRDPRLH